jgi:hypothetical protein
LVELSGSDRWVLYKSVAEMIWAHAQEEGRKAETLARLNGTLPPEKPGEDDRKPAIVTTTSKKQLKLRRADERVADTDGDPEMRA